MLEYAVIPDITVYLCHGGHMVMNLVTLIYCRHLLQAEDVQLLRFSNETCRLCLGQLLVRTM